jgi:hypothetical protein
MFIGIFQLAYSFQSHCGPEVDSASNRPGPKADNLTAVCESLGPPRRVTGIDLPLDSFLSVPASSANIAPTQPVLKIQFITVL